MQDIKKYCEYLYHSYYIPIYLYDHTELIACYPEQGQSTIPPSLYLLNLCETDKKVSYLQTSFYSHFGCVQIENSRFYIIFGPVNDIPYSNESLLVMRKEYSIENPKAEEFAEFFLKIPQQNLDCFINTLLLINYTINNIELTRLDIDELAVFQFDTSINKDYSEKSFNTKEIGLTNNNHIIERELMRYIETGNIEKLKEFSISIRNTRIGILANNNLRHWKNHFIVLVTLAARAAIRGGLTPSISYQLSDIYIQHVERLSDMDAILSLISQVQLDYANRVANSVIPPTSDYTLHKVIQYVRENTNKHITVADIADHVGFTRSYLSRKVKKELGIELRSYIIKCKLEESKDLLAFSDKSISEISNYLCFSSQSHFQTAFKDLFKITPHAYRKSVL
ncbi:MAG: helix-turn-helix domain-containing protein [Neobacillus sp.]